MHSFEKKLWFFFCTNPVPVPLPANDSELAWAFTYLVQYNFNFVQRARYVKLVGVLVHGPTVCGYVQTITKLRMATTKIQASFGILLSHKMTEMNLGYWTTLTEFSEKTELRNLSKVNSSFVLLVLDKFAPVQH